MTTSLYFPGPRDGLDEGSLAELAQDSREVKVEAPQPRPWVASTFGPIDVPDDASALIDGLAAYGGESHRRGRRLTRQRAVAGIPLSAGMPATVSWR